MQTIRVAAALIQDNGRLLAAKRADKGEGASWEFPGGKIEEGEAPEEALRREIREELGCELQLVYPYDTVEHDYHDFHLSLEAFVCTLAPEAKPQALEHAELRWLSQADLMSVDWLAADEHLAKSIGVFWDEHFSAELL